MKNATLTRAATVEELLTNASPATRSIIERLNEYVERKYAENPTIPQSAWWTALHDELVDLYQMRKTEG